MPRSVVDVTLQLTHIFRAQIKFNIMDIRIIGKPMVYHSPMWVNTIVLIVKYSSTNYSTD